MNVRDLQAAIGVTADGQFGPVSRAALLARFTNPAAPAITTGQMQMVADRLGVTLKQLAAVAKVESAGGGFDAQGRPKILFERHIFHRLTGGKWSVASFSNPTRGGYSEDSWGKLLDACAKDPDAAFSACSWGKFQILGSHWNSLGYPTPFAMAQTTVQSEAAHYEMLARFIEVSKLQKAMQSLSSDPAACAPFAARYNGPAYRENRYDTKLALAMRGG